MLKAERTGKVRYRHLIYEPRGWFKWPRAALILQVQWRISGFDIGLGSDVDYLDWRDARPEDVTEIVHQGVANG